MNQIDGQKAAEYIRKTDEAVSIILLTTLVQHSLEGYKYQADNYIIKPMKYARLKIEMDKWMNRHNKKASPSVTVSNDTGKYKVFLKNLRYVETYKRRVLLHTESGEIACYKSMKEMEEILGSQGFVRCHTSFLVNLYYVKGVEGLDIKLISGETVPISQPKRKAFMEQLAEYWGDML